MCQKALENVILVTLLRTGRWNSGTFAAACQPRYTLSAGANESSPPKTGAAQMNTAPLDRARLGATAWTLSLRGMAQSGRSQSDKPNVPFILADDLDWGDTDVHHAHSAILRPRCNEFASQGTRLYRHAPQLSYLADDPQRRHTLRVAAEKCGAIEETTGEVRGQRALAILSKFVREVDSGRELRAGCGGCDDRCAQFSTGR